ncbi:2-C-methyl-D-erythritol 4-phosphate cytidylyltransferase [Beduinella massiliensis]|uniref:2-C-methyl-D-erythritol 4-phosphate cytidylyltransferase n=1 Tax=Beduinella massiliensis TaxID=1852363 RepID=UPI000C83EBC6
MNEAIIVAAGKGVRMGLGRNKVLAPLFGVPVLVRTVRAFADCPQIGRIGIVAAEEDLASVHRLLSAFSLEERVAYVTAGGMDRQESVRRGLEWAQGEIVLIHDGARPFVTPDVIERTIRSARECGSGVAAVMLKDTVKRVDNSGCVLETPPREDLRAVQTPQTFPLADIRAAHEAARSRGIRATDDAALLEKMGKAVHLVEGDVENIKLTTPEDMHVGEAILRRRGEGTLPVRVGQGYDVHRLVEGRRLILCGVEVPYERGLLGHSDADVAAHALMDALLGAAALGDIGRHFPDTDPAYAGADSMKLLSHVVRLVGERGYRPGNVDVTIVAQRPKLKDFIPQMRLRLSQVLGVGEDAVNVKATTTERLGFEGEGLGISAQAVATIVAG